MFSMLSSLEIPDLPKSQMSEFSGNYFQLVLPPKQYTISKVLFSFRKNRDCALLYVLRTYEKIVDVFPAVQLSSFERP
jgi:hypothetical protein